MELHSNFKTAFNQIKRTVLFVGFMSMFINIFMLAPALYMLQLYDRVVTGKSEETLLMLSIILVFVFIFLFLLDWLRQKIMVRLGNKLDQFIKKNVFNSLFKWSLNEPSNANVTPLRDLFQIRNFITSPGLLALFDAPWTILYLIVLFVFHTYFGLFALFSIIVIITLVYMNEKKTKQKQELSSNLHMQNIDSVNGYLKNSEVVHAMGMKDTLYNTYNQRNDEWITAQTNVNDNASTWSGLIKYLRLLFQSVILGIGAYLVINMELTPGMMISGSLILGRVLAPLDVLASQWKNVVLTRQSLFRLSKLLNESSSPQELMQMPEPKGNVRLEKIVVYPPKATLSSIKGIDLSFEEGDIVSIIGSSASGKSSLLKGMLGIWPLTTGKVTIDGVDIRQWESEKLGEFIGYLPQDIELFDGTVSQNIARMQEVDSEKVIQAAKLVDVHDLILKLPQGYNTQIGPQGLCLSGGQRQRIALARAIYGNVKIVVLDEPNSNLDDTGELALVKAIQRLKSANITVIMVTHKMNIIQYTDKVVILKEGLLQSFSTTKEFFQALKQKRITNG